jgi:hypothetical protein
MAVPLTGTLSLGKIRQELQTANYAGGPYTAAATGLDPAENGTYATINTCSPYYPLSANPANMSEWYGYDHDAPCSPSTGSYYDYDGGLLNGGYLRLNATDFNRNEDTARLIGDMQGQWTLSMWLQPGDIKTDASHTQYNREYPIWEWHDMNNGYHATIYYIAENSNTQGVINEIIFHIAATTTNLRFWKIELSDATNAAITGVDNGAWGFNNLGNVNANDFVNLGFVYDNNQGSNIDKFTVYWNGTALTTTSYGTNGSGGPANLVYSNTHLNIGYSDYVGTALGAGGLWFGFIDWVSYVNGYASQAGDMSSIWNSGLPYTYSNLLSIGASFAHWNLDDNADPELDESAAIPLDHVAIGTPPQWTTTHA